MHTNSILYAFIFAFECIQIGGWNTIRFFASSHTLGTGDDGVYKKLPTRDLLAGSRSHLKEAQSPLALRLEFIAQRNCRAQCILTQTDAFG